MTATAETWLPDSALADVRSAEPAARCLRDWSVAWFAHAGLVAAPRWERWEDTDAGTLSSLHQGAGFRLLMREDGRRDLAGLILGQELGDRSLRTPADHAVIEHLAARALADLGAMLGRLLTPEGETAFTPDPATHLHVLAALVDGAHPLLWIEADRRVIVRAALAWVGAARHRSAPTPFHFALAEQPIQLSARIGRSRLTLAEIDALEAGDVLPLDTPLSAPLAACIDDATAGAAALSVHAEDGRLMLQIERPASQW